MADDLLRKAQPKTIKELKEAELRVGGINVLPKSSIKNLAELEKAIEDYISWISNSDYADEDYFKGQIEGLKVALEKIGDLGKTTETPIEKAKQAVEFIKWHIGYLQKVAPYATSSIKVLEDARDEIDAFVHYDDKGNRRGDGKSG